MEEMVETFKGNDRIPFAFAHIVVEIIVTDQLKILIAVLLG